MTRWSDQDIRRAVQHLRVLYRRVDGPRYTIPEGAVHRLDVVERKLIDALNRDREHPAHDGYPSGNSSGRSGGVFTNTSVETAALNHLEHGNPPDPHHADTTTALDALATIDEALRTLLRALDSIDHGRKTEKHSNPGGDCVVCGRYVEGTAEDRLRRGMCAADHRAWLRAGQPELEFYVVDPDAPPAQRQERERWATWQQEEAG